VKRRSFLLGASGAVIAPRARVPSLSDGQTVWIGDLEFVATDIAAPAAREAGHDRALAALGEILAGSAPPAAVGETDRWGRITGVIEILSRDGRTSVQAELVRLGAARVTPQSADHDFIRALFMLEDNARRNHRGLWRLDSYRVHSVSDTTRRTGLQIYKGVIRDAAARDGRVFFNFGDDYRSDVTATTRTSWKKKWRHNAPLEDYVGRVSEIRGEVEWINGPSIELKHELQMRLK
jgi:endonuclease YncB( thermonuclease family)